MLSNEHFVTEHTSVMTQQEITDTVYTFANNTNRYVHEHYIRLQFSFFFLFESMVERSC